MSDCCLIKKVATVEVYENKNEVRAYGFMAGDKNTPMMEVKFKHLWGEENLSKCKLRWIIVDDLGSLLVGEVPIEQDNTASIQLPNELFTGERRMKVQLTVASCDGSRILNLQQFTDLKVINNLASNEVVEPVYQMLINQVYDDTKKYLAELETSYKAKYGSLESVYAKSKASLEQYLINAENGGNAEFLQGHNPKNFNRVENTINELINSAGSKYEVGDVVEVLGYYTAGDGAHHKRKIESADDGSGVQLANGLWANIVHNGEVNVSWFGAKGDGVTDDSESLHKCLFFSTKKTMIADTEKVFKITKRGFLKIYKNTIVDFKNSTIMYEGEESQDTSKPVISNYSSTSEINENIEVKNLKIVNKAKTMGLCFSNAKNIKISNFTYVYKEDEVGEFAINLLEVENVIIDNAQIDNLQETNILNKQNGNDGIHITSGKNILISNSIIKTGDDAISITREENLKKLDVGSINVGGTSDVKISNCTIFSMFCPIKVMLSDAVDGVTETKNISISNCTLAGNQHEFVISNTSSAGVIKNINFSDCDFEIKMIHESTSPSMLKKASDITFSNVRFLKVFKERYIVNSENVFFKNCYFKNDHSDNPEFPTPTFYFKDGMSKDIHFNNCVIEEIQSSFLEAAVDIDALVFCSNVVKNQSAKAFEKNINVFVFLNKITNVLFKDNYVYNVKRLNISSESLFSSGNVVHSDVACTIKNNQTLLFETEQAKMFNQKESTISIIEKEDFVTTIVAGERVAIITLDKDTGTLDIKNNNRRVSIESRVIQTVAGLSELDTPFFKSKMEEEGVYKEFYKYREQYIVYEQQRRYLETQRQEAFEQREDQEQTYEEWLATQPILIPDVEPQPSEKLLEFKNKYIV